MPTSLILMKWDERLGVSILAQHPEAIEVTNKTLMQIYSTHEYSGEAGLISENVSPLSWNNDIESRCLSQNGGTADSGLS